MTVSEAIARFFYDEGYTHAFGIIGAGNVRLFDAINRLGSTQIICTHHEQAAAMAATAYWRVCGKLAPVLVTTGAGSANVITGVLAAWMDSIPLMVISGNEASATHWRHRRAYGVQGYNSTRAVCDITKHAFRILPVNAVATVEILQKHKDIALEGRMGPVWIDVPTDVQDAKAA